MFSHNEVNQLPTYFNSIYQCVNHTLKLEHIITTSENERGIFYPYHPINLYNTFKKTSKTKLVLQNPFYKWKLTLQITVFISGSNLYDITDRILTLTVTFPIFPLYWGLEYAKPFWTALPKSPLKQRIPLIPYRKEKKQYSSSSKE